MRMGLLGPGARNPSDEKAVGVKGELAVCALFLVAAALTACSDSPSAPQAQNLHLEVVSGDAQRGLADRVLSNPIVVRVVDAEGLPRSGVTVAFEVLDGGGSVRSASLESAYGGRTFTKWMLGGQDARVQRLRAYLPDAASPSSVVFEAVALRADETDVVIFRNAVGPLRGVLVVSDDEHGWLQVDQEVSTTDTIVPLQPMAGANRDLLVFPQRNPPLRKKVTWTDAVDTAFVELQAPFPIDAEFEIFEGPYEDRLAVIQKHLQATQKVWDDEGMGLVWGEVTISNHIKDGVHLHVSSSTICSQAMENPWIRVEYVYDVDHGSLSGYACGDLVFMGLSSADYPTLLAHEIGHLFTLGHTLFGVMKSLPGSTFTDGEVFRAHFEQQSILNRLWGYHAVSVQRSCPPITVDSPCLRVDYELPGPDPW